MLSHEEVQTALRQDERTSEIEAHLAECGECDAYAGKLKQLDGLLALDVAVEPSAAFERRVLAEVKPKRQWMRWALPAFATAALLVVMLPRDPSEDEAFMADNAEMLVEMDMFKDMDAAEDFAVIAALGGDQ